MTINQKMEKAGLPYSADNMLEFVLSGGTSVVALYQYGETFKTFVGFHPIIEARVIAREVRKMRGVYSAYVVNANPED